MRFTRVGDGWIGYRVMGESAERAMLFLPTVASNVDAMDQEMEGVRQFFERVSEFATVVFFDRRGTGVSDGVPGTIAPTLEDWAEDALAVLDQLGLERVCLLAHGLGVAPALLFAAAHPSRVESLVLMQGFARLTSCEGYDVGVPESSGLIDRIVESVATSWGEGAAFFFFNPHLRSDPAVLETLARNERATLGRAAATRAFRTWLNLDVRDVVGSVQPPTLILQGTNVFSPLEAGRWLAQHLPDARIVEYDNENFDWWNLEGRDVAVDAIEEFVTGTRTQRPAERILATVLFTDIVSSTERVAALGDRAWRDLLDRYRTAVREQLHIFHGREINTRGDDFLATFDGPARAIRCALALTVVAARLDVTVRTGLHTGEIELMGDDIGGIAVHIGARVAALADPGEVLVSRTVTDLVAGSGIEFTDRGEHELNGIPGTWRLLAVGT